MVSAGGMLFISKSLLVNSPQFQAGYGIVGRKNSHCINLAFAHLLLRRQCNVVFADLALRPEAKQIVAAHSSPSRAAGRAVFQQTDVREWPQLERMFHTATKEFGGADIVCPGAGVYEPVLLPYLCFATPFHLSVLNCTEPKFQQPFSSFWYPPGSSASRDLPGSSRYALLDINLTHPIRTTQLGIAHFLSNRSRSSSSSASSSPPIPFTNHIIHISSIAGQVTPLFAPMYNASKHGISGFVRSLAPLDHHHQIRVTAVAPGVIDTPLWRDNPEKLRLVDESAGDKWVSAEEVAEVMGMLVGSGGKEEIEVVRSSAVESGGAELSNGDGPEGKRMVRIEGGLILEIGKGRIRKVEQFNDEGPRGAGTTAGKSSLADGEIFDMLESGEWGV
ncbi:MAG: hypothetical protein Q9178_005834 [Gyalolechia marmorata]